MRYPYLDLIYTWHEVPSENGFIPWTLLGRLKEFPGHINSELFDESPNGQYYPAGTLLCGAPEIAEETNLLGRKQYRITYHFQYRRNGGEGWNCKYSFKDPTAPPGAAASPGFFPVGIADTSPVARPYPEKNFNLLFKLV